MHVHILWLCPTDRQRHSMHDVLYENDETRHQEYA